MRWIVLVWVCLVLGIMSLDACGARTPLERGERAPDAQATDAAAENVQYTGSLSALCSDYVDALCRYYVECARARFRDLDECHSELDCYGVPRLIEAIGAGRVGYDAARAGQCLTELANPACGHFYLSDYFDHLRASVYETFAQCPGVLMPREDSGQTCYVDQECVFGEHCVDGCPGVCQRVAGEQQPCFSDGTCYEPQACLGGICRLLAHEGESCGSSLDCFQDLICDATGHCASVTRAEIGDPCQLDFNGAKPARLCRSGLFCDWTGSPTLAGTCRAIGAAGARCLDDGSCLPGNFCLYLPAATPTCQALSQAGGPCGNSGDCESGLGCSGPSYRNSSFSTCAPLLGLGEACSYNAECEDGLLCDSGRCVRVLFPGDACGAEGSACVRGTCSNGRCVGPARISDPCASADDCATHACLSNQCIDSTVCVPGAF